METTAMIISKFERYRFARSFLLQCYPDPHQGCSTPAIHVSVVYILGLSLITRTQLIYKRHLTTKDDPHAEDEDQN